MRILQALYSGLGGHASVAFTLAEGFKKKNFDNFFVFYGIEKLNKAYKQYLSKNEYSDNYIEIEKRTKLGFKEWRLFYKYLKKIKPDIILLHSLQLIIPAYSYGLFYKSKIISVEHDAISNRTKIKWIITNINSIMADKVVVLTDYYRKEVEKKLWFKFLIKKYTVIPNGIDVLKYTQKSVYFKNQIPVVFMASRINKLRDHETLANAIIKVNETYPVKLRIAGDGDMLDGLMEKYSGYNFIEFLGNIDENQIIRELQNTDIYVHATFAETFSTAILQAMSCGLPIITSDIPGTRHMIEHNGNGLLYKNKNVEQLAEQISTLLNNPDKAVGLGVKARQKVKDLFNDDKVVNKYVQLIESL